MNRFFCFYTAKTGYADEAERCAKSFKAFGVDVSRMSMLNKRNWMATCMARCAVLQRLSFEYSDDGIGLLDSDLTCLRDPVLLKDFSGDVAVHDGGPGSPACMRYSAGVLVFGATPRGRACLDLWVKACRADATPLEELREQLYLKQAIEHSEAVVTHVGDAYNKHIDRYVKGDDTVILHHVASRKLKKTIGGAK